ncbi:FtsW/RodA/SpoVE family cell cycle protein [Neopoerus faecalis]|uniref:FtsW/RodA/SpoVE family cell cycle protein n=1 Tax=Neopoerus faecalis TaxID=3032125 RepID=UPI0025711B11|nr:FtsW/RodA/SpoVE family cell cycle protein [Neopoerus faecalis]
MLKRIKESIIEVIQGADLILLGLCCTASLYGIAMIFSATRYNEDNRKVLVQTAALLIGIVVYFAISMIDLELLMKRWKWIAAFNAGFILLLLTPFGREQDGNRAWLKFPFLPVSIGPAEVVKITFIILLAWQFQWLLEEKRDLKSFSSAFMAAGHAFGMAGLYFIVSRDMGNAMMFVLIFVVMAFVSGFALRWFVLLGAAGTIGGIAVWTLDLLPSYMKNRFLVLFDHSYDVQNQGYQQTRSLLTIGGGGFWGQGYLHGTQTQAGTGSIPARHTDLIFAVIGEELGFVGATLAILILVSIIIRVVIVGRRSGSMFHTCVCVGIASMLAFQMIINIGMCLFIMPVIGLTLPFFSYGGSSIVTLFAAMGFVSGIKMRTVVRRRPGRPIGSAY